MSTACPGNTTRAPGDQPRAAALITAALAETEHLDVPAEAAKLQRLRERLA